MDFSPHPCVEQDQDRCHDGSQSHQSTLRRQSEQPAQSVRVTRSRWGRQKRCKADRAAQQSPHSSFSLESIRLIVRRKPNRPGQHLSQKLTAIGDVRREQGSPVGHALPDAPFNQRSIDSSALHGLMGGGSRSCRRGAAADPSVRPRAAQAARPQQSPSRGWKSRARSSPAHFGSVIELQSQSLPSNASSLPASAIDHTQARAARHRALTRHKLHRGAIGSPVI
jgi:hypothetical protein